MMRKNIRFVLVMGGLIAVSLLALDRMVTYAQFWTCRVVSEKTVTRGFRLRHIECKLASKHFDAWCVSGDVDAMTASLADVRLEPSPQLKPLLNGNALAVINGGYFNASFEPVGLLRIAGAEASAATTVGPMTACLVIDSDGVPRIVRADDPVTRTARSARQCGPFLIEPPGANGIRSNGPAATRSVFFTGGRTIGVLVTSVVSLSDLADCLTRSPEAFGVETIEAAVNLDGGPSCGLVVADAFAQEPAGRVTDAIVLTARSRE